MHAKDHWGRGPTGQGSGDWDSPSRDRGMGITASVGLHVARQPFEQSASLRAGDDVHAHSGDSHRTAAS